jgi:hypothetical protein
LAGVYYWIKSQTQPTSFNSFGQVFTNPMSQTTLSIWASKQKKNLNNKLAVVMVAQHFLENLIGKSNSA